MALKLIANYSKRLGLPGYSSHQFSVCVETEISNIDEIEAESTRLYQTLQQSVDEEIQHTGFVPDQGYGQNGRSNGHKPSVGASTGSTNGNGHSNGHAPNGDAWACSERQQELILKLVDEHHLDKGEVDGISQELFGVGVKELNKLQASGLIDRILDDHGGRKSSPSRSRPGPPRRTYQNGGAR